MNMRRILGTLLLITSPLFGFCQDVFTGIISNKDSAPLPNTTIRLLGSSVNIFTDENGAFKLNTNSKGKSITISHVGYKTTEVKIENEMSLLIFMEREEIKLEPINLYKTVNLNLKGLTDKLLVQYKASIGKEEYAEYEKGWSAFHKDLEKNILEHRDYFATKHSAYASFTVTKNGNIENISVKTGSTRIERVVGESLKNIKPWTAASQNGTPADQHFGIQVRFNNDVLMVVEQPAVPLGGYTPYYEYLKNNLNYPQDAYAAKLEGKVYVQFEIYEDGSMHEVLAVKGLNKSCNAEATRLIKDGPKWVAPMQSGHPVKQRIVLPIAFKLSNVKLVKVIDPIFPGGKTALTKFIKENKADLEVPVPINKVSSTVILEFQVKKTGGLTTPRIVQSLGEPFDAEAIRLYSIMPPWIPAKESGIPLNKTITSSLDFGDASSASKQEAKIHFDLGVDLFVNKEFKKSIDQFAQAISKDPLQHNYYFNRAVAKFAVNEFDGGCEDLTLIKDLDIKALNLFTRYCIPK